jgi:predicted RecB family nuclease
MGTPRTCPKGHRYVKSSDCPVCPICTQLESPESGFLATLSNPARRALEGAGIDTVKKLADYTQKEVMALHGMGPSSLPKLQAALKEQGLEFRS